MLDMSIMTTTLNAILAVFEGGAGRVQSGGVGLLSVLIGIEITWAALMWALEAQLPFRSFLKKIVFVGMFAFLVLNWTTVANTILDGFIWAGMEVGGAGTNLGLMRDPSQILNDGMMATAMLWEGASDVSFWGPGIVIWIAMVVMCLAALVMYFLIAIHIFMTLLEFYIIVSFGVIYIPWGVNRHTKWIAERYFGAIVAQGTKVMVLTALLGVVYPILRSLQLSADPSFQDVMSLAFGVGTITFVVFRAPSIAGGLMSGAATLHAGEMMGAAAAGGATVSSGVMTAGGAAAALVTGGAAAPVAVAAGASTAGSASSALHQAKGAKK